MDPTRRLGLAGGLLVSAGTLALVMMDGFAVPVGLWALGAVVAPLAATGVEEGLESAAFATAVSLPLVVVGLPAVIALTAGESVAGTFGASLLGVVILLPFLKLGLAVPLLAVGAVAGFLRGLRGAG